MQANVFVSGYVSADEPGIHRLTFDSTTGTLTPQGALAGIPNPSFLITHSNGRWVYAVGESSEGTVWALQRDEQTDELSLVNSQPSVGDGPCHLVLDASERWILVSNYGSGSIALLPILDDGSLGEPSAAVQHSGSGPNASRQEGPHAHSAIFTPDGTFAVVADLGIDQLVVYRFDPQAGTLLFHAGVAMRPGSGPRHTVFHPQGHLLYVAYELDNTVSVFAYEAETGSFSEIQFLSTLESEVPDSYVADIHITPDASRLYVSNRGDNSLAVFGIAADGTLERLTVRPCGGNWPRNFALSPDGGFVLIANQQSDDIAVLPLLPEQGEIGEVIARTTIVHPACVQFAS